MTCSHCGSHNPENSPFCGSCGKNLKTTVHCNSCGDENPSGSLFCGSCGNTFDISEQKDSLSNYSLQKNLTTIFQYLPKYFWVLLICVLIGGLLIWGLSSGQTSSNDDTSHTYITPESVQRYAKTPTPTTKQQDVKKQELIATYQENGIQYLQNKNTQKLLRNF